MRLRAGLALVLAVALATVSCVKQTRVVKGPAAAPVRARETVWDRQIRNAKDAGDGDYQMRTLRERVAAEPDNVPIRLELARVYRERGYPEIALDVCRLAAARFPDSGAAQLALAGALRDMKRQNEALPGLEAFLKERPEAGPEYYSWLGILHDDLKQWTDGETAHRKAIELDGSAAYLRNNLGYNFLMQRKYGEAAGEFRAALQLDPSSRLARNNLGLALAEAEKGSEAVAAWQAGSDAATAHNNLAAVWMEKGNYAAARKELETALSLNKSLPAALKNLELVSRLDGAPVLFHVKQDKNRWARLKTGLKRFWVGPLAGSRSADGEQR